MPVLPLRPQVFPKEHFEAVLPFLVKLFIFSSGVLPSPATHAIWIQLKAGETADLLWTVKKTLLDSTWSV